MSNVVAALAFFFLGSCFAECECPRAIYIPIYGSSDTTPADTLAPAIRWVR